MSSPTSEEDAENYAENLGSPLLLVPTKLQFGETSNSVTNVQEQQHNSNRRPFWPVTSFKG